VAASLRDRILAEIDREGPMTCARFVELALYDDEGGYYMAEATRAGREWITAPTLSPIFGHTLAELLAPALAQVDDPRLVEPGTGGGELARDLAYGLHERSPDVFDELDLVPVDRSPAARQRARETIEGAGIGLEALDVREVLPDEVRGAIVANELLDALPTHVCQHTRRGLAEIHLERGEPTLSPRLDRPSDPAIVDLARGFQGQLEPGLRFEVPLAAYEMYREAADRLREGLLVTVDYGGRRRELLEAYPTGTIHGYRQGQRVEEFWYDPGRMDVTYRVPFDEVARVGEEQGLETLAYGTQGEVLDALGIRERAREAGAKLAAKKLIDPDGAGGTFRVLVQGRGIDGDRLPL
jgi:SAM-dependent MidA family methyltransferase